MAIRFQQLNYRTVLASVVLMGCAFLATACGQKSHQVAQLRFVLGDLPADTRVKDLRFYIHDIYMIGKGGVRFPFEIADNNEVALLDLGADVKNRSVSGSVAPQNSPLTGVEFKLGVPFHLNHADPLTAKPPLNDGTLFWAWQQGYKFLRFDFESAGTDYSFHLGSTGCESASAIRPPQQACRQPNIVTVRLTGFDPARQAITVNADWLVRLLAQSETKTCTGNYAADAVCAGIVEGLGLSGESGQCVDQCSAQQLFTQQVVE